MTYIEWKPEYSVGVASIDQEHREMIDLINATYEKLEANAPDEEIEQFLGDIYAGIAAHFALEEKIMQKAQYKEYQSHKQDHEKLLDHILNIMDDFVDNQNNGSELLQQQLSQWFKGHFATFDARLHKDLPH